MSNLPALEQQVSRSYQKLRQIEQQITSQPSQESPLIKALIQELSLALEELQVATEELQQQNEFLLLTNRQALDLERQRYQDLFDFSPDGYLVTNPAGLLQQANQTAIDRLNLPQSFLVGKPLRLYLKPAAAANFYTQLRQLQAGIPLKAWEVMIKPRHDPPFPAEVAASPIYTPTGQLLELRWQVRDISERKTIALMSEQLNLDTLTQITNRRGFDQAIEQAWEQMRQEQRPLSLLLVDIDFFKRYNDTYGHQAGDVCLQDVAKAMDNVIQKPTHLVARYGGEEFAVLLPNTHIDEAKTIANTLLSAIKEHPIVHCSSPINQQITLSVGLASLIPTRAHNPAQILVQADQALYQAKASGRNRLTIFTDQTQPQLSSLDALKYDLSRAFQQQQFKLLYQPIVNLFTGDLVAVETLVRWQHPTQGLLTPLHFLPLAERTGLLIPLSWWILKTACAQLQWWQQQYHRLLLLHINIPAQQFYQVDFVEQFTQILTQTNVQASTLMLEITETALLEAETYRKLDLQPLQDLGVQLAIDDFGSGYSSLSRLQALPVSQLKLDHSLIPPSPQSEPKNLAIIEAVIALTQKLNLTLVAKGIETPEQEQSLRALGCPYGQGFLFSNPLESDAFEELLSN